MSKVWQVTAGQRTIEDLAILQSLLCRGRGVNNANQEKFFSPDYSRDIHNPHLLYGMREAVDKIYQTVESRQRILIWGDYDADGVTATATLAAVLQDLKAKFIPYLPHRADDGYGLNQEVLQSMLDEFDLLITVDCGVSNIEEISWLKKKGKDVIVVDHHELPDKLPPALVIHPRHPEGQYPWGYLCGAGVAWKLSQALLRDSRSRFANDADREKWLLDLTLLGTIGDIMPLLDENRAIVKFGLAVLERTRRPGLQVLLEAAGLRGRSLTVEDVAFRLTPLLNAAGRMDHPQTALNVLLAQDTKQAQQYVEQLQLFNQQRQSLTRNIMLAAYELIDRDSPIIFAANMDWPAGVVGLVAGKLAAKFSRPAVVIGSNGRHGVGSARTANGINILEGLQTAAEHTMRLGGHAQAAGFSLQEDKIESFRLMVQEHFQSNSGLPAAAPVTADAVLSDNLLNWDTHDVLNRFEPYGPGNLRPSFIVKGLTVIEQKTVGKNSQHTRFAFATRDGELEGIAFGMASDAKQGAVLDVLGQLDINEYRGRPRLQFRIDDFAPTGQVDITEKVK